MKQKKHSLPAFMLLSVVVMLLAFATADKWKQPAAFASDVQKSVQKSIQESIASSQRGINHMVDEVWAQAARDNFDND